MILDLLSNRQLYRGLPPRLVAALDFLEATDLDALALGKTVIDGDRLFALVQEYRPKPANLLKYEAHRRYWDVQYVVWGVERIPAWCTLARKEVDVSEPYDAERDVAFFSDGGDLFHVPQGTFAIFGPHDVHMPGIAIEGFPDEQQPLNRKIVLKVEP